MIISAPSVKVYPLAKTCFPTKALHAPLHPLELVPDKEGQNPNTKRCLLSTGNI